MIKKREQKELNWKEIFRADLVRQIMAANEWTEAMVAARMATDQSTFNKIKNSKLDIRLSTLVKLASALGVQPHELVDPGSAYVKTPTGWQVIQFHQVKKHE